MVSGERGQSLRGSGKGGEGSGKCGEGRVAIEWLVKGFHP